MRWSHDDYLNSLSDRGVEWERTDKVAYFPCFPYVHVRPLSPRAWVPTVTRETCVKTDPDLQIQKTI